MNKKIFGKRYDMKILIIATPRTGSTELTFRISRILSLKPIFEPFIDMNPFNYKHPSFMEHHSLPDDCVVKSLVGQIPYRKRMNMNNDDLINICKEFYEMYSKNFDKVILLGRHDLVAQAESWNWFTNKNDNEPYVYTKQPHYDENLKYIHDNNRILRQLSRHLDLPITYYEDIYNQDSTKGRRYE
jgi:hypothetical protein